MKLREMREAANLTQDEAAVMIGVHQSAIAHWEAGRTAPRMKRLIKIAEVYQCTVSDLLGDIPQHSSGMLSPLPERSRQ